MVASNIKEIIQKDVWIDRILMPNKRNLIDMGVIKWVS